MLLLYQVGSVKIGEVVRYTVTYTPCEDRILPSPRFLYVRIRNTSAIALRAAFVHGPYTLCVAAYPARFDPNEKLANPRQYGVPEFEPMLKAGGVWECRLTVPDKIREKAGVGRDGFFGSGAAAERRRQKTRLHHSGESTPAPRGDVEEEEGDEEEEEEQSASWVIEVSSQVIFSASAAVGYEVLVARDEKALSVNTASPITVLGGAAGVQAQVPVPGRVSDHQQSVGAKDGHHPAQPKGVFSRAVSLRVEDTASLWNHPRLPGWDDVGKARAARHKDSPDVAVESVTSASGASSSAPPPAASEPSARKASLGATRTASRSQKQEPQPPKRQMKVHLVVLTHGIHSNLGADMLFLKESIDAAVRQARIDRKARLARERAAKQKTWETTDSQTSEEASQSAPEEEEDDEEVIVRGFSGNATRTEKGIKYLGKRLARYVMSMTYPDQPFLPSKKATSEAIAHAVKGDSKDETHPRPAHKHSTVLRAPMDEPLRAFKITSISFISHSLGGLVQTYAVAYIQKHSPQFFDLIRPINFITMASPFLGLSNENPLYVRFALDFGLVGRTGQDLGLTWRPPTLARSGWGAIVNLGESAHKKMLGDTQPESKPLLRILPTGPAHTALKKFRNRTVYSNVVNDGIVPLRTSCLLFLDWQGLGRVDKARREAGLVETVVGFGWAELTGANIVSPQARTWDLESSQGDDGKSKGEGSSSGAVTPSGHDHSHEVPQPSSNAILDDDRESLKSSVTTPYREPGGGGADNKENGDGDDMASYSTSVTLNTGPFAGFFNLFRSSDPPKVAAPASSPKQTKIYRRSQTIKLEAANGGGGKSNSSLAAAVAGTSASSSTSISKVTSGHELHEDDGVGGDPSGGGGAAGGGVRGVSAPPRTTFFESASDIMNPKLPSIEFLIDPARRPRTIFHDRVYHPSDIPPPPLKRRPTTTTGSLIRRASSYKRSPSSNASQKTGSAATTTTATATATSSAPPSSAGGSSPRHSTGSANGSTGGGGGGGAMASALGGGAAGATSSSRSSSPFPAPATVRHQDSGMSAHDYDDRMHTDPERDPLEVVDGSGMRVEEKIARAYHRGLSWRKVLVKLEPDAHNNMVVRRMFANAFGWPVVKHLCDAHFSDSATARVRDDEELGVERARAPLEPVGADGRETKDGDVNIKGRGGDGADTDGDEGNKVQEGDGKSGSGAAAGPAGQKREAVGDELPVKTADANPTITETKPQDAYPQKTDQGTSTRSESLSREALDLVSDLPPPTPRSVVGGADNNATGKTGHLSPTAARGSSTPGSRAGSDYFDHRRDSVAWSDGDFVDSGEDDDDSDDNDDEAHARVGGLHHHHHHHGHGIGAAEAAANKKEKKSDRDVSPGWSWADKIAALGLAGKTAATKPESGQDAKQQQTGSGNDKAVQVDQPGGSSNSA